MRIVGSDQVGGELVRTDAGSCCADFWNSGAVLRCSMACPGASRLASSLGVSPIVVGLTVVSLGTSAPELVVCLVAALQGNPGLAIGNVMGSNLANIGLILGLTSLVHPWKSSTGSCGARCP